MSNPLFEESCWVGAWKDLNWPDGQLTFNCLKTSGALNHDIVMVQVRFLSQPVDELSIFLRRGIKNIPLGNSYTDRVLRYRSLSLDVSDNDD